MSVKLRKKVETETLEGSPDSKIEYFTKTYWRPAMAWIYMSICIFDFILMPIYSMRKSISPEQAVEIALQMPEKDRVMVLQIYSKTFSYNPMTLGEGGFIHIAFGAILGVAAWTRGREKEEVIRTSRMSGYNNRYGGHDRNKVDNPDT